MLIRLLVATGERPANPAAVFPETRGTFPLSSEERAGVRTVVKHFLVERELSPTRSGCASRADGGRGEGAQSIFLNGGKPIYCEVSL